MYAQTYGIDKTDKSKMSKLGKLVVQALDNGSYTKEVIDHGSCTRVYYKFYAQNEDNFEFQLALEETNISEKDLEAFNIIQKENIKNKNNNNNNNNNDINSNSNDNTNDIDSKSKRRHDCKYSLRSKKLKYKYKKVGDDIIVEAQNTEEDN